MIIISIAKTLNEYPSMKKYWDSLSRDEKIDLVKKFISFNQKLQFDVFQKDSCEAVLEFLGQVRA